MSMPAMQAQSDAELLSVIVPAYNEEEVLHEFHQRLTSVLNKSEMRSEIVYVNDGSSDRTLRIVR